MKILNMGSANLDHVYQVRHFIQPGETDAALDYTIFPGGKGLNQSIAIARAGGQAFHTGAFGEGSRLLKECLTASGVDISYAKDTSISQGHAIIQVNRQGENCIIIYAGSNHELNQEYIDQVLSRFGADTLLVLQNEINHLDYIIEKAHELGMKILLNPSPMDEHMQKTDFNKVTWLILNEIEGEGITGYQSHEEILRALHTRYPVTNIVLTLGKKGCLCICDGNQISQKSYPVEAIDTTAAGDTFTGYLVACIAEETPIANALAYASAAAAISVTRKGASSSVPYRKEVEEFLKSR